jgi:hypothetical protein
MAECKATHTCEKCEGRGFLIHQGGGPYSDTTIDCDECGGTGTIEVPSTVARPFIGTSNEELNTTAVNYIRAVVQQAVGTRRLRDMALVAEQAVDELSIRLAAATKKNELYESSDSLGILRATCGMCPERQATAVQAAKVRDITVRIEEATNELKRLR